MSWLCRSTHMTHRLRIGRQFFTIWRTLTVIGSDVVLTLILDNRITKGKESFVVYNQIAPMLPVPVLDQVNFKARVRPSAMGTRLI